MGEFGKCGDELSWIQEDDTLYIVGRGEIDEQAFYADQSIREVVIGAGCTGIGESAFESCYELREVELPEGLRCIGKKAFYECNELSAVTLRDGLLEIGKQAFATYHNQNLKLHIPNSVTKIGKHAFLGVREIVYCGRAWDDVGWLAEQWVNIHEACDGGNWKIKDNTLYVYVTGELPLEEVEVLYKGFPAMELKSPWQPYEDSFEHVVIAPGCTKIPRESFYYCRSLKTISIPGTVTEIERYAFSGCKCLTALEIPDSVTKIGESAFSELPNLIYNGPAQSDNNWGAEKWTRSEPKMKREPMPDLEHIKNHSKFKGTCGANFRYYLYEDILYLEGSGELVQDWNLWNCRVVLMLSMANVYGMTKLFGARTIIIGEGCTGIGYRKFSSQDVDDWDGWGGTITAMTFEWAAEKILLPESLQSIGKASFSGCNSLKEITIPKGVKKIGEWAFAGCERLSSVLLTEGLEEIGSCAFKNCRNLRYIKIPDSVTEIGEDAFEGVSHIVYHGPAQSEDNWGAKSRN